MLTVLSPAKRLDWSPRDIATTTPDFADDALRLAAVARGLSVAKLRKLMGISENLAQVNAARFAAFGQDDGDPRPAIFAFAGDTYAGLDAGSLDAEDLRFAQERLRILSGLYGLLRPQDAIRPYRLEMGSRLKTRRGASLYDWWGDRLAKALNAQAESLGTEWLLNCASVEYFSAVAPRALRLKVITPVFLEDKPGGPRIVSFFAKKARGAMARYVIERRLTTPEGLLDFDLGGYRHAPELSEGGRVAFLRAADAGAEAA